MNKEFVPYEQALALKELGFDEPCLFAYNQDDENKLMTAPQLSSYQINSGKNSDKGKLNKVSAPLYQQAFKWLYQKLDIKNGTMPLDTESQLGKSKVHNHIGTFDSLEDANKAYKEEKKKYILSIAEQYKKQLNINVYNKLINYEV
jgi:hypothetical protein